MGVWDMMYLMQQYKTNLAHAENPVSSYETRTYYADIAEVIRQQMFRYLQGVEESQEMF